MELDWFGDSITGNYRKDNEDNFIFLKNKFLSFVAICDGMGGCQHGKLASWITIEQVKKRFNEYNFSNFNSNDAFDWLEDSVYIIFNKMIEVAATDEEKMDMGTTCIFALIIGNNVYLINIGDCRLYIYNNTKILKKITTDQNLLNEIGWENCNLNQKMAKLLTSALGPKKNICIDRYQIQNVKGELLFSTDGFHDYVGYSSIKKILASKLSLKLKVDNLIESAIKNLSSDNITVLLIKI